MLPRSLIFRTIALALFEPLRVALSNELEKPQIDRRERKITNWDLELREETLLRHQSANWPRSTRFLFNRNSSDNLIEWQLTAANWETLNTRSSCSKESFMFVRSKRRLVIYKRNVSSLIFKHHDILQQDSFNDSTVSIKENLEHETKRENITSLLIICFNETLG